MNGEELPWGQQSGVSLHACAALHPQSSSFPTLPMYPCSCGRLIPPCNHALLCTVLLTSSPSYTARPPAHPASGCACLQGICLVKQKRWGCSTTVVRHKAATALTLSSTIWTNSQAIVEALQRSNNTCADTPAGVCTAFGPPYNYDVLITLKGKCCMLAVQLHFTSAMRDWLQRT